MKQQGLYIHTYIGETGGIACGREGSRGRAKQADRQTGRQVGGKNITSSYTSIMK